MASQSTVSTSLSSCPSLPSDVSSEVYQWGHPTVIQSPSWYDSQEKVECFVQESGHKGVGQYFDLAPCKAHERVCDRAAEEEPDFFFVYATFFTRLPLQLPVSSFACNVLSVLRIAPTQLLSNGWAFVYAFECLCRYLSIPPSTTIFFYFFQVNRSTTPKGVNWASIHGVANRSLLTSFSTSFKNFKDCFLKVLVRDDFPELILTQRGWLRFPLYWKSRHIPKIDCSVLPMPSTSSVDLHTLLWLLSSAGH